MLFVFAVFTVNGQNINFVVNMSGSGYPESGKVIRIGGSYTGSWSGDLLVLTESSTPDVYTGTLLANTGDLMFRMSQADEGTTGWSTSEWISNMSGSECDSGTTDGANNYLYSGITTNTNVTLTFDYNGCYTVTEGTLSTKSYDLSNLSVYPNPAKELLNINANEQISSISIYNLLGSKVLENKNYNNRFICKC